MRYIDLCPSAQMLARKEVIENTKEFRKFRLESETILENLIKDDCSIELSFSTVQHCLNLNLVILEEK